MLPAIILNELCIGQGQNEELVSSFLGLFLKHYSIRLCRLQRDILWRRVADDSMASYSPIRNLLMDKTLHLWLWPAFLHQFVLSTYNLANSERATDVFLDLAQGFACEVRHLRSLFLSRCSAYDIRDTIYSY